MAQTKAALQAENAALRMELNTLREQMNNMASVASAVNSMQLPLAHAARSSMPAWQAARAEAMAAAKALALSSHKTVRAV